MFFFLVLLLKLTFRHLIISHTRKPFARSSSVKKIPYQILPNDTDTWQNDNQQTFPILIETELMEFLLKIGGVQMLNDVVLGPTKISDIIFLFDNRPVP